MKVSKRRLDGGGNPTLITLIKTEIETNPATKLAAERAERADELLLKAGINMDSKFSICLSWQRRPFVIGRKSRVSCKTK